MIWILCILAILLIINKLNPKFDKTNYGDIIVWLNCKGKRIFKYIIKK